MSQNSTIILIVLPDRINNGTEADHNLPILVLYLKMFNGLLCSVGSAWFVVTNVDDPALGEMMTYWDLIVDRGFRIDAVESGQ